MLPSADVVVVGGGVIGTATSFYLAQKGVDVSLVERVDIASGTSSSCTHGVALQTKTPGPKLALARRSLGLYTHLADDLEADLEFEQAGSFVVAQTEAEAEFLRAKIEKLSAYGVEVCYLDQEAVHSAVPVLAADVLGASHCTEDATINPMHLTFAFARAARRHGATVRTFTRVVGIEHDGGRITGVLTDRGKIPTETVVNAAGVWAPMVAQMVGLDLPISPRKGELVVTERVPPLWRGTVLSASYLMSKAPPSGKSAAAEVRAGVVASRARSGNVILGSTREFAGHDLRTTYRGVEKLLRLATGVLPALREVHILRFYAGLRPSTPDGLPILSRWPELPGFVIAAGHEGDGIALSPITGKLAANLITDDAEDEALAYLALSRFAV